MYTNELSITHPPVSPWAWHNRLAMFVILIINVGNIANLIQGYSGNSIEIQTGEDKFFATTAFLFVAVSYILGFVCMSKMGEFVHPLRIRGTANWATWGWILMGIGPIVAWVRIKRAERRYYQTPDPIPPTSTDNDLFTPDRKPF